MPKRPTGFSLIAFVLGLQVIHGAVALVLAPPHDGDPYRIVVRAAEAAALLVSAALALALWRCERWVGYAGGLWFAALYLRAVVRSNDTFAELDLVALLFAALWVAIPAFVLAYILERAARLRRPAVVLPRRAAP